MAQKKKEQATVLWQQEIAPGIYDCRIKTSLAQDAAPGQFVALYPRDKSTLLPRPISICEVNKEEGSLRLVYRVAGKGTGEFSAYREGGRDCCPGRPGKRIPSGQGKRRGRRRS